MSFNLADMLKEQYSAINSSAAEIVDIDLDCIDEDARNFYSIDNAELEALAANIELVGQLDPVVVRRSETPDKYILLSGHRRCRALRLLRDEGKEQFKTVKAIVRESDSSPEFEELVLIFANSNTRKLSSADLNKQTERVTELLYKLKEQGVSFPGRMRDHVAEACQISKSKLARLQAIRSNLAAEFYSCYEEGTLNESAAYALSRMPIETQEALARFKKVLNLAQKKDGISSVNVVDALKHADEYQPAARCKKDKTAACTHCIERYAATICRSSWMECRGECCCDCSKAEECAYPCKHAKAQLTAAASKRKAEKKEAEAKRADEQLTQQAVRRLRHMTQILRLADLCDRAGLADDENVSVKSWQKITAGALRKLASEGLPASMYFYDDDYNMLACGMRSLEQLADKLKCTVGELAGEDAPVSKMDTSPWRHNAPEKSGDYLGRYGNNCEIIYYDSTTAAWHLWVGDDEVIDNVRCWMPIPEET